MILQEISKVMGMPVPVAERDVKVLMVMASKVDQSKFAKLSVQARIYLGEAISALKLGTLMPLPVDWAGQPESDPDEDGEEGEDDGESAVIAPARFECAYRQKLYAVDSLLQLIDKKAIKLPDFQRELVWNRKRQREFIGSRLMGIPTQNLTLSVDETRGSQRYILDGYQRVSALALFKAGKLTVGPNMPEYTGKTYEQLPEDVQQEFLMADIAVIEVTAGRQYWSFIFQQINKGGVPLNSMEIRRAAFNHPLMLDLEQVAKENLNWIGLFGKNYRYKGLAALLRSVAMYMDHETYQKPVDTFLDTFCWQKMGPDSQTTEKESGELITKLDFVFESLTAGIGKMAFRTSERKQVNLPLLDCLVLIGLKLLDTGTVNTRSPEEFGKVLATARHKLLAKFEVFEAITKDTSGKLSTDVRMKESVALVEELSKTKVK